MISKRIKLKKLYNTRDLGGMKTLDGKTIVSGKLVRSGRLSSIPPRTVAALLEFGVTQVVDFRIPTECREQPDVILPGVGYENLPITTTPSENFARDAKMRITVKAESKRLGNEFSDIDEYMREMYLSIVSCEEYKKMFRRFLRIVIENEGCLLFHCASGKDRAGIASMLVESLLGVDEESIINDYLASRGYLRRKYIPSRIGIIILPVSLRFKRILCGLMRIKREYLEYALDYLKNTYGSVVEYCKAELGVTEEDIQILKSKYLV